MSLSDLVSQLQIFSKSDSHRQVLDLGSKILSQEPTNVAAFKQCLVALINLDNYKTAREMLDKHSDLIAENRDILAVELAYIYYKLDDEKSLAELVAQGSTNRGLKHVLAQHYYRVGKNEKALEIYRELLNGTPPEEVLDLSVNERAVLSQMKVYSEDSTLQPVSAPHSNSYDQKFNSALILLRDGDYEASLELLREARQQCLVSLADYEEEEQLEELAPIDVEIAFLTQLLSGNDAAKPFYDEINVSKLKNQVLKVLITTNLASFQHQPSNAALLYKNLGFPQSLNKILDRLAIRQIRDLHRNEILLAYKAGKSVSKSAAKHEHQFPESLLPQALAAISKITEFDSKNLKSLGNEKLVFREAIRNPQKLGLCLFAAQLSASAGKPQNAARVLEAAVEADSPVLLRPAVACLLFAVYDKLDRENDKIKLLLSLYQHLISAELKTVDQLKLLKFVAFQMITFDEPKSQELFLKLQSAVSSDPLVSVVLGGEAETSLGNVDPLILEVDTDSLLEQGLQPLISKTSTTKTSKGITRVEKRKRNKPKKLPKDLSKKLDEERWLPMKDRSYYKPKKGKKGKDTQGGLVDQATEESLNIGSSSSTPAVGKKQASKKKKGKK
ncbi:hypothetical protein KL918_004405 [Ogataea parapolymorpha]|uniref:Signal recognition particle subunit SRP72 n=1 Tax=Ogataea parapolymorpha (strain ATCC 26012 / BCRC 20466 / JCM 22074 / NRRL Y-7560 / DL-1) TaxID=871575 RepID=W1QFD2_OGAPD|nr:signal recognition particle subunit SRP72 [Ogataea parapolymorpha DL-1]ESX00788.1 signal recognition particle subunit SRP72 [Ogataea parapolymorpha DL-1]KAG7865524.1 hypothetical protein KL918_004405 [Ogataea parapolymorpha]KAG7873602.1 hypothetical protein KL916_002206 [Ogataea parapolymorpha]